MGHDDHLWRSTFPFIAEFIISNGQSTVGSYHQGNKVIVQFHFGVRNEPSFTIIDGRSQFTVKGMLLTFHQEAIFTYSHAIVGSGT
jgi:hypothetical protein